MPPKKKENVLFVITCNARNSFIENIFVAGADLIKPSKNCLKA